MKKYPVELTKEQLEQLGLEVPKFELSEEFWKIRTTYSVEKFGIIKPTKIFYRNINNCKFETELPTIEHAEASKVLDRLMMIQYEMNDGEVLDEGYGVYTNSNGVILSKLISNHGIKFKTVELAEKFLEENREDLEKIRIMGF